MWQWSEVIPRGSTYLRRLHLLKTPWFSVYVHWILQRDPQPDLHDHPVDFLSIVLRGGYVEEYLYRGHRRSRQIRRWNFVRHTDLHRIVHVKSGTITLCFAGKHRHEWGFHTSDGWVCWKYYDVEEVAS